MSLFSLCKKIQDEINLLEREKNGLNNNWDSMIEARIQGLFSAQVSVRELEKKIESRLSELEKNIKTSKTRGNQQWEIWDARQDELRGVLGK